MYCNVCKCFVKQTFFSQADPRSWHCPGSRMGFSDGSWVIAENKLKNRSMILILTLDNVHKSTPLLSLKAIVRL